MKEEVGDKWGGLVVPWAIEKSVDLDLVRVWQASVKEQVYENQRKIPFV